MKNVKTIFTSPLRRAIQTAYEMFKYHENFLSGKIRVVILPELRESLHCSCDVAIDYEVLKKEVLGFIPFADFSIIEELENSSNWNLLDHDEGLITEV